MKPRLGLAVVYIGAEAIHEGVGTVGCISSSARRTSPSSAESPLGCFCGTTRQSKLWAGAVEAWSLRCGPRLACLFVQACYQICERRTSGMRLAKAAGARAQPNSPELAKTRVCHDRLAATDLPLEQLPQLVPCWQCANSHKFGPELTARPVNVT